MLIWLLTYPWELLQAVYQRAALYTLFSCRTCRKQQACSSPLSLWTAPWIISTRIISTPPRNNTIVWKHFNRFCSLIVHITHLFQMYYFIDMLAYSCSFSIHLPSSSLWKPTCTPSKEWSRVFCCIWYKHSCTLCLRCEWYDSLCVFVPQFIPPLSLGRPGGAWEGQENTPEGQEV